MARDFKAWCRSVLEEEQEGKPPAREQILDMLQVGGEDRRFALRLLVEYGYGKPTQPVDISVIVQEARRIADELNLPVETVLRESGVQAH